MANFSQHSARHTRRPNGTPDGVVYPDGSVLNRPLDMPRNVRMGLLIAVIVAAIIGGIIIYRVVDAEINAPEREQQELLTNIQREVTLDLPPLAQLLFMDDEDSMQLLIDTGATFYETVSIGTRAEGGFEVVKLPQDVSLVDAGIMYAQGINNLSGSEAAKLLNGSWVFTYNREGTTSVRVRYADFHSGTADAAIDAAMAAEGLADAEVSDSGVDDAGNTFRTGNLTIDGTPVTWRVSVVPLSDVYSVSGFPSDALYVGIRFTR